MLTRKPQDPDNPQDNLSLSLSHTHTHTHTHTHLHMVKTSAFWCLRGLVSSNWWSSSSHTWTVSKEMLLGLWVRGRRQVLATWGGGDVCLWPPFMKHFVNSGSPSFRGLSSLGVPLAEAADCSVSAPPWLSPPGLWAWLSPGPLSSLTLSCPRSCQLSAFQEHTGSSDPLRADEVDICHFSKATG